MATNRKAEATLGKRHAGDRDRNFLKTRLTTRAEGHEDLLPPAQTAWGPEWDTPEEDEAWLDL